MRTGDVIENPLSGETIVIRQTGSETDGQLFSFELFLAPGGRVPSSHAHPLQEERFSVIEGRMKFRVGLRRRIARPGETVVVPPGRVHAFANAGPERARLMVEVRPALNMAEMFDMAAALARHQPGRIPNPLDLALFLREFEREVVVPFVPRVVVRAITHPLAKLAASCGLDAGYRRLQHRDAGGTSSCDARDDVLS